MQSLDFKKAFFKSSFNKSSHIESLIIDGPASQKMH